MISFGPPSLVRALDGTAAAPSMAFLNDTNTGFHRPATGVIGTASVGNDGVRFFTSGTSGRIGHTGAQFIEWTLAGGLNLVCAGTNQNITLTPSGTGLVRISSGHTTQTLDNNNGNFSIFANGGRLLLGASASVIESASTVALLLGTSTNSSNGRIQLATHTTPAGGYGFADFSLWRHGAALAGMDADFDLRKSAPFFRLTDTGNGSKNWRMEHSSHSLRFICSDSNGNLTVNRPLSIDNAAHWLEIGGHPVVSSRRTGWGVPTGTLSRATFATGSVTLQQLAERVAALISDLHATSSGHGLIGA